MIQLIFTGKNNYKSEAFAIFDGFLDNVGK